MKKKTTKTSGGKVAKAKFVKDQSTKTNKATVEKKPQRVSALNAAAEVLKKAGKPMRCIELIAAMSQQGLWSSPGGKTPSATLHAAIGKEIIRLGRTARFKKINRGQFEYTGA